MFALNLKNLLNIHNPEDVCSSVTSSITSDDVSTISVSADDVFYAFQHLKRNKTDQFGVSSNHILYASSALIDLLASFFSAVLWHGYMPEVFRYYVVVPIPKGHKDASCSTNYRGIAIASIISKPLEWVLLSKYSEYFQSSELQFGFKKGVSTTLCTGLIKIQFLGTCTRIHQFMGAFWI